MQKYARRSYRHFVYGEFVSPFVLTTTRAKSTTSLQSTSCATSGQQRERDWQSSTTAGSVGARAWAGQDGVDFRGESKLLEVDAGLVKLSSRLETRDRASDSDIEGVD